MGSSRYWWIPAFKAPPELKPNQPNQRSPVPIAAAIKLLGFIPACFNFRLPSTIILAKADYFALANVGLVPSSVHAASIPFTLFFLFQLMFCVITVPLISGAFAERLNMKGYILLDIFWTYLVYIPVCHWVWGNGLKESEAWRHQTNHCRTEHHKRCVTTINMQIVSSSQQ